MAATPAKVLWPLMAAAEGYSADALNAVSEQDVQEAEAQVICSTVWKLDQSFGPLHYYAVLCDGPNKPFEIQVDSIFGDYITFETLSFTPYSSTSDCLKSFCPIEGTFTITGKTTGNYDTCTYKWTQGTYLIDKNSSGNLVVTGSTSEGTQECSSKDGTLTFTIPGRQIFKVFEKGGKCKK